jgi:hypothetical protein
LIDPLVYNIPASMVAAYRGRNLIVRSRDPAELIEYVSTEDLPGISYLQILALGADVHPLVHWGDTIPVDLVVQDQDDDLPKLYRWSPLLANHPVRVTIPVVPGFSKAVKLSVSLNFAVKLKVSLTGPAPAGEMLRVLDAYLHQTTITQPIEYFHSVFLSFYRKEPVRLWAIQEEDPAYVRYIGDDGEETISRRCEEYRRDGDMSSFVPKLKKELLAEGGPCSGCEFFEPCAGYFRFLRRNYVCESEKAVFKTLKGAAEDLRGDVASFCSGDREKT